MQLTPPLPLLPDYTAQDILDAAHVLASTTTSSTIASLRYDNIPKDEQVEYLRQVISNSLAHASHFPRIRDRPDERHPTNTPDTDRYEALAVRDLDLPPVGPTSEPSSESHGAPTAPGRIVSYLALRYNSRSSSHQAGGGDDVPPSPPFPASGHATLQAHFGQQIERALSCTFGAAKCYEVREMVTLSPSHLRKGIAKRMMGWIGERADRDMLPVVLAGSPAGVPLYRAVGFEEVGGRDPEWKGEERWSGENEGVVRVDLEEWGGKGVHRHSLMVRFPQGWEGKRDWWGYVEEFRGQKQGR